MVIKTDYDIGQEVYRAVWDKGKDFGHKWRAYVNKFKVDRITITTKGVYYHLTSLDRSCIWSGGWAFASPICLTFSEAQEYARTSQETMETFPR